MPVTSNYANSTLKRAFDIVFSLCALVLLLPVALLTGVGVKLALGDPIIFRQERAGRDAVPFVIFKFRSLSESRDLLEETSRSGEATVTFGKLIRKFSLDEIPQFINVLLGDMSIVGPRPLYMKYNNLYSSEQRQRLLVRPGMTGLAQIKGRNSIHWEEKFIYDIDYLKKATFFLDIYIVLKTLFMVTNVFDKRGLGSVASKEFLAEDSNDGHSEP